MPFAHGSTRDDSEQPVFLIGFDDEHTLRGAVNSKEHDCLVQAKAFLDKRPDVESVEIGEWHFAKGNMLSFRIPSGVKEVDWEELFANINAIPQQ